MFAGQPHLQLPPLDPAHTAGGIAPGLLGPEHQFTLPKLVGACSCHLSFHLLKPLLVGLRAAPVKERGAEGGLVGWGAPKAMWVLGEARGR